MRLKPREILLIIAVIIIMGGGIGLIAAAVDIISRLRSESCHPSKCMVIPKLCTWETITYPCYSSTGDYVFTYHDTEYTYATDIASEKILEVATVSCRNFLVSEDKTCYFELPDIQDTIRMNNTRYQNTLWVVAVGGLLVSVGIIPLVILIKSIRRRRRDAALLI